MIFTPINYFLFFDDILYSVAAGFLLGIINQILSIFLHKGTIRLLVKDILLGITFAVVMFSFVVSFANYNILRFYHVLGGLLGFLSFTPAFSKVFNKIFLLFFLRVKRYILLLFKLLCNTGCVLVKKAQKGRIKRKTNDDKNQLPNDNVMVYNQ